MTRRGRCQICDELFAADPRIGKRQLTCHSPACQEERHRLNRAAWHQRERSAAGEEGGSAPAVAEEGQRSPVLVVDDVLIDGYHRVRALEELGRDLISGVRAR